MRNLRTGTPQPEMWEVEDIMSHLKCDKSTADKIMEEVRRKHNRGYDTAIEKHLILDYIEEKQRIEREREARHNADLASARQVAILEEQVKALKEQTMTLKEMYNSSSADARKAYVQSLIANFISFISIAVAIIALALK